MRWKNKNKYFNTRINLFRLQNLQNVECTFNISMAIKIKMNLFGIFYAIFIQCDALKACNIRFQKELFHKTQGRIKLL